MPDADGYYGFYRGANKVMKRKLKSRETSAFRHNVARADYY